MSDTDDTDVLVLIPHDFFTVSSSEDEQPLTEVTRPLQRRFYSPNLKNTMSQQEKDRTPSKPTSLASPYKNGENFLKRNLDFNAFRPNPSSSRSDFSPQKTYGFSPSKVLDDKFNFAANNSSSLRGASAPKEGSILTTYEQSSPTSSSKFRRSTSDLPTLTDSNSDIIGNNGHRQRSLTGDTILPESQQQPFSVTQPNQDHRNKSEEKQQTPFRNPEQPTYDSPSNNIANRTGANQEPQPGTSKPQDTTGEKQPLVGENASLPYVCGDNIGSIPDLGFGIREFLASLKPTYPQSARTPHDPVQEEPCVKRYFSPLGGEAVPNLSGSRRQLNFDQHGESTSLGPREDIIRPEKIPSLSCVKRPSAFVPVGSGDTRIFGEQQPSSLPSDLLSRAELTGSSAARSPGSVVLPSLTQLWRDEQATGESHLNSDYNNPSNGVPPALLHQKLEEERYRRMHLEQLICELQQKLLRESERVAVATQVDARKDDYLMRLKERYEGTAQQWQTERNRFQVDVAEKNDMCTATIQRLRGCERELSKALDLASGFQQRSLELEREKTEGEAALRARVLSLERQYGQLEQESLKLKAAANISEHQENKRGEQMAALQNLIEDERQSRHQLESENKRLLREAEEREATALTLEAEKETQQAKLKDAKQRMELLEQQKSALQQSLEDLRKKERSARQEIRDLGQAMEQSRQSLKEQYQAQLDQVVRAKLAEFQSQLDNAEAALRQHWENREAEMRNKHARALSEIEQRNLAELRQVEERHSRDIAWWQRSLSQAMAQIQELTSELERQEKHREQLAGKIHSMLQAQYQQAANIIWEPNASETSNGGQKMNGSDTASTEFKGWASLPSMNQNCVPRQLPPTTSASENQLSEASGGKLTTQTQPQTDQLKKYIEMRQVNEPLHQDRSDGHSQGISTKTAYIPELDFSKLSINLPDKSKSSKDNQNKPPWK